MKLIKTCRRQRLTNAHLNDCMVIKANSASIGNFDPTPAINSWMVTITKLWSVKLTIYFKKSDKYLLALTATSLLFVTDGQQITQKDELQKDTESKKQVGRRKISWRQWKKSGEWHWRIKSGWGNHRFEIVSDNFN